LSTQPADVRLESVRKSYGDIVAVDGIDLDVSQGEFFTMLGPSGSGKTTMLRVIAGFESPDEGRVLLKGADVTRQPPYERDVNTVFQDYALFPHMTVGENVAYGLKIKRIKKAERTKRTAEVLELVRLGGLMKRKPSQLSGGQRQRVAIARAILKDPPILLLDEATSALDNESERLVQEALERLKVGRTTIIVAHRLSTIRGANRIAVLDDGWLVELGTHDDLLARDGLYAKLYRLQFESAEEAAEEARAREPGAPVAARG